jgi:integrase
MSVKHVTFNGSQKVWMARISYKGVRRSRVCGTKEAARQAERELSAECRKQAEQAERTEAAPATVKHLCEYYVLDLERRGKGAATISCAVTTAKAIEAVAPALLTLPVGRVTARDVFDFRQARLRRGTKASTINGDLRTLRAMLEQARPDFRFPGAAFLPEDETRVRWLRPEEELLIFDTLPAPFGDLARLAALTLMRQGELRTLRRDMVHLEQGVVMLPRAKAGARSVILSAEAQKILGRLLEGASEAQAATGWVFPGPGGTPYSREHIGRVWRRAARAARAAGLSLPRPAAPRSHHGAQPRLHGADRPGARRLEDRAHDAALRGHHRRHAARGGRGRERCRGHVAGPRRGNAPWQWRVTPR